MIMLIQMLFYTRSLTDGIRGLIELNHLFHKRVINGIVNGVGITSFSCGDRYKIFRGSRTFLFTPFFFTVFIGKSSTWRTYKTVLSNWPQIWNSLCLDM